MLKDGDNYRPKKENKMSLLRKKLNDIYHPRCLYIHF